MITYSMRPREGTERGLSREEAPEAAIGEFGDLARANVPRSVHVFESYTEGGPTRVVLTGDPDLGKGPTAERLGRWRRISTAPAPAWSASRVDGAPRFHLAV